MTICILLLSQLRVCVLRAQRVDCARRIPLATSADDPSRRPVARECAAATDDTPATPQPEIYTFAHTPRSPHTRRYPFAKHRVEVADAFQKPSDPACNELAPWSVTSRRSARPTPLARFLRVDDRRESKRTESSNSSPSSPSAHASTSATAAASPSVGSTTTIDAIAASRCS